MELFYLICQYGYKKCLYTVCFYQILVLRKKRKGEYSISCRRISISLAILELVVYLLSKI